MEEIKLTQYSHGAGCGCKISPKMLSIILHSSQQSCSDPKLLVGNKSRDDAAVYDLGNGTAIISTTDFFLPIVDDPYTFGKIAATNAISDVYAMGGKPLMAIAILGWPVNKIAAEVAALVLEGGRAVCKEAGIELAGGHSIDNPEPLFGLAVTGTVDIKKLKRNDTATTSCRLYLTKPLGVGILATAQKKGLLSEIHKNLAPESMMKLNDFGAKIADIEKVKALTDVTGFGLLGHLTEMCEGSNLSAVINYNKVPVFEPVKQYIQQKCIPGGTFRNWDSYGENIGELTEEQKLILCDPQTSGGLLIAVEENASREIEKLLKADNLYAESIGYLKEKTTCLIAIQ